MATEIETSLDTPLVDPNAVVKAFCAFYLALEDDLVELDPNNNLPIVLAVKTEQPVQSLTPSV